MARVGLGNTTDYQYQIYADYLEQVDGILTKYGQQTGLSIEYWHIKVDESKNFDDLKMQNSYKHFVYDLYHFVPTINMTPLTYQIGYNQQQQGTSNVATGSFSMYLLDQPLPGDIFRFYPYGETTVRTELFRITNVRYMRTSNAKLKLYQLDFETAPMLVETLEHVRINEIFCWDTENFIFVDEEKCNNLECIQKCRDTLIKYINNWYDEQNGWYGLCREGNCSNVDWAKLCRGPSITPVGMDDLGSINPDDECPDGPPVPEWPPGPGWPGWNDSLLCEPQEPIPPTGPVDPGQKYCNNPSSKTRPLVFLNTILKRLKKIYPVMDIEPIFGIGTAKIPINWIMPFYELDPDEPVNPIEPGDEPVNPIEPIPEIYQKDYWDTHTCLSYQPKATAGELFNVTKILNGDCVECPPELVQEIECNRELYVLVMALVMLLAPGLTEEQLNDTRCDRKCCDMFDPEFVGKCLNWASTGSGAFDDLFWDSEGALAGDRGLDPFCGKYQNRLSLCTVPLYISWQDGAVWPSGHKGTTGKSANPGGSYEDY
jgi:hypothetical protein